MSDLGQTRAFVVLLRAEHRRLHKLLRRIENDWMATREHPQSLSPAGRLVESLEELRIDLTRHFHQEEGDGCLEEAACRCPSLGQKASEIERQHPLLLEQLGRIIERASGEVRSGDVARQTRDDFRQFARNLHEHEAAENQLLASAFGTDAEELETK